MLKYENLKEGGMLVRGFFRCMNSEEALIIKDHQKGKELGR